MSCRATRAGAARNLRVHVFPLGESAMNTMMKAVSLSLLWLALAFLSVDVLAADAAAEVAAIHSVDQSWLKAYNGGDADSVAGLYDEKAILLPPGAPAPHGRAAIRAFFVP